MPRPKIPVETRLTEEWTQAYRQLLDNLARMTQLESAMKALNITLPHNPMRRALEPVTRLLARQKSQ